MRARLLAVTHEYSASGAPVALRNALTGLTARYEIEVAGPNDGPLRAHYASAGIRAVVVPGMLEDARVCAELVAPHDLLLANTIVRYASVRAANALNTGSIQKVGASRSAATSKASFSASSRRSSRTRSKVLAMTWCGPVALKSVARLKYACAISLSPSHV